MSINCAIKTPKKIFIRTRFNRNMYKHFYAIPLDVGYLLQVLFEVKISLGAPRRYSRSVNQFHRRVSRLTLRGERFIPVSSGEPSLAKRVRNSQLCLTSNSKFSLQSAVLSISLQIFFIQKSPISDYPKTKKKYEFYDRAKIQISNPKITTTPDGLHFECDILCKKKENMPVGI